ncbi:MULTISPECIES: AAA family ATPase [unclassified Paenibacillus]|uniref:AAA family ATPase n=1 Tax=unclassified Paenibacillus TaxID=185978 RepID=UPI00070C114E|nr:MULTISPECIES: AAA family ATPase [unclassified Paenibacillus]KQX56682.1 hypothetical protein ASD40_04600 [Paenibacillus sp. Root444D2]KRE50227.1 hypothetical protein ASG85_22575 [Paenibacillus sp. Soil724D2]
MRKLIFFIGPAGAGKTTLAKAWARKHGGAFLDMDTLLRPAAEAIMTLAGQDPNDRDSPTYKTYCRDLGYRITMDAALENLELGLDAIVVGPFTKELADPLWLEKELSNIGATINDVCVRAVFVYLPSENAYQERIQSRGSALDVWKLDNWKQFSQSLVRREIKWVIDPSSILYFDNSGPLSSVKLDVLEEFINRS